MLDKNKLSEALGKMLEDKGKRKFKQSVELIINMRGIDFTKSENRLSLDILLPKGKGGKELKVGVIAEENIANQAKKGGADLIISPSEITSYATKAKLTDLAKNYVLLTQPNVMAQVAKSLGQYLGPRGKLPKPIIGNVVEMIERSRKSIRIASKGKYLPVAHAFVGTEIMGTEDLAENIDTVYEAVKNKVTEGNIKNVYIKLTMGKPVKVM